MLAPISRNAHESTTTTLRRAVLHWHAFGGRFWWVGASLDVCLWVCLRNVTHPPTIVTQVLKFRGKTLSDDDTLVGCSVTEGSQVGLGTPAPGDVQPLCI